MDFEIPRLSGEEISFGVANFDSKLKIKDTGGRDSGRLGKNER